MTSAAARLNCIAHLLSLIPYEEVPREKVKLPKRPAERGDYVEPDYPYPPGPQASTEWEGQPRTAPAMPAATAWYA